MASWSSDQFHKVLESGKIGGYYCFLGEDSYLVDRALKALKPKVLEGGLDDFNYDVFYGNEIDMLHFAEVVETLPMMGQKRLVILKDAHLLKVKQMEALLDILSLPQETTVMALVFSKVDKRKKIYKDIFKNTTVVDFKSPNEKQIHQWINFLCSTQNKKMAPQVAQMLQNFVGIKLIDLDNEIRKLALYVGERADIEFADLEAVVCKTKLESVFNLTESLGKGKLKQSLIQLKQLLDQGENELALLAMITRHIRLLLFAKEGLEKGMNKSALSAHIGVPPFFLHQYTGQAQSWSHKKLHATYKVLQKTDASLKSTSIASKHFMENLVTESCRPLG